MIKFSAILALGIVLHQNHDSVVSYGWLLPHLAGVSVLGAVAIHKPYLMMVFNRYG